MWHFKGKLIASCLGAVQVFPVFYLSDSVSKNQEIGCGATYSIQFFFSSNPEMHLCSGTSKSLVALCSIVK